MTGSTETCEVAPVLPASGPAGVFQGAAPETAAPETRPTPGRAAPLPGPPLPGPPLPGTPLPGTPLPGTPLPGTPLPGALDHAPPVPRAPDAVTAADQAALGQAGSESPEPILGSLSPSRAADFKACPLLYRFRCIDRLPESPSPVAVRGTLVHAVLESLFDLPAAERTLAAAHDLMPEAWARLREEHPELDELFAGDIEGARFADWLASARGLLRNYFDLEDPTAFEPEARELQVEFVTEGVRLRGIIDRIDVSAAGDVRVVDYKTGASPGESFEAKALFQMKFYALVLWRLRGVVPRQLRLIYLGDTDTLSYSPDAEELERFERTVMAIWAAVARALETGDFQPSPGRVCEWCDYQDRCPAFGNTPPPYPARPVLGDPRDDLPAGVR